MAFKRLLTLLIVIMFVLPSLIFAGDDFDEDDFSEDDFGSFEEDKEDKEEFFDAEESAEKKKKTEQSESDAAMKDLLGDDEKSEDDFDENKEEDKKEDKKEDLESLEPVDVDEDSKTPKSVTKGLKPVLLIKGGFTILGKYRDRPLGSESSGSYGSMFGSVDEGLLGAEFEGSHVIAKGTINLRTMNPFITKGANPLAKTNLHSIQDGWSNGLFELYGGMRFFGVFVKAGKMVPEYGLLDTHQTLGMGFSTPFLTRGLSVVEGFVAETDAGFAIGYENTFAKAHTIHVGLMLGTGSNNSEFWSSDKTMGLYVKAAYAHKYFQAAFGLQYKTDYSNNKNLSFLGIGFHANVSVKGFEMPISFDYNQMGLVKTLAAGVAAKTGTSILLSVAPGYAYSFKSDWADKVSVAVRFDYIQGIYVKLDADGDGKYDDENYLNYDSFKSASNYMRIGVTANFFAKEFSGVHSYAGITFLVQPERKVVKTPSQIDYGFLTLMFSAGAEF